MPGTITHPVRPGGLDAADQDTILDLAGKGLSAWQIARRIERQPGTVAWFMYRAGLMARTPRSDQNKAPYRRKGILVRPFTDAEDALLLALRRAGHALPAIAAALAEAFGHRRQTRSLATRLMMLASYEAVAEDARDEMPPSRKVA